MALNERGNADEDEMNPELLKALGLDKDATEVDAVKAANSMKAIADDAETKIKAANAARSTPDMAKFVPRSDLELAVNRAQAAEQKIAEQNKVKIDADIEAAVNDAIKAGKVAPASKDFYVSTCKQENGVENFKKYLEKAPVIISENDRKLDGAPDASKNGALSDADKEVCARLGVDEKEFLAVKI